MGSNSFWIWERACFITHTCRSKKQWPEYQTYTEAYVLLHPRRDWEDFARPWKIWEISRTNPPVPQARELYFSLRCSPHPTDIYLQEEDSNERNGEGDHHFGIFLCWQLLQGWQKALWKEVEGVSQTLVPFPFVGAHLQLLLGISLLLLLLLLTLLWQRSSEDYLNEN